MTLGMKVGLGLGDFVMDGDQATPRKEDIATPPNFWPMFIVPNGWMDEDATWYESRPRPRPHCARRGPSCPRKRHSSPSPVFGPCQLWPRSPISAILLSSCFSEWLQRLPAFIVDFRCCLCDRVDFRPVVFHTVYAVSHLKGLVASSDVS